MEDLTDVKSMYSIYYPTVSIAEEAAPIEFNIGGGDTYIDLTLHAFDITLKVHSNGHFEMAFNAYSNYNYCYERVGANP